MTPPSHDRPESLWKRTAEPVAADSRADRAEIVVVGAGITGLAAAVMLARQGREVMVLEGRSVGAVTTGNTTGKLSLLQGSVAGGIRKHAGDDILGPYFEGNRAAQDWVREVAGDDEAIIQTRTAYTYATTPEGDEAVQAEAEAMAAGDVAVERDGPGSDIGLPFPVTSALRLQGQAQLHPLRLLSQLAAELRGLGGRVVEDCRVTGADLVDDGVRLRTAAGDIHAGQVVLATGTPILDRGLFFAKLSPSRSLAGAYRLPDATPVPSGMYLSVDPQARTMRSATDTEGREVLVAGGESFVPGRVESVLAHLTRLDDWVAEHYPGAVRTTWWAAQDYRMVTHVPFAGALPRGGGRIYTATGYNKWGLTNGVAAALAISGLIGGEQPEWAARLQSHHPSLSDAAEAMSANAQVGAKLVGGWSRAETSRVSDEPPAEGTGRVHRSGLSPIAENTVDGVTCRLSAVCTHLGGIVSWNDAELTWDCPLHGSRFSADGRRLEGPAVDDLSRIE